MISLSILKFPVEVIWFAEIPFATFPPIPSLTLQLLTVQSIVGKLAQMVMTSHPNPEQRKSSVSRAVSSEIG